MSDSTRERPTCTLCDYPADDALLFSVPLAHPPQSLVVCRDCFNDLEDLAIEAGWRSRDEERAQQEN